MATMVTMVTMVKKIMMKKIMMTMLKKIMMNHLPRRRRHRSRRERARLRLLKQQQLLGLLRRAAGARVADQRVHHHLQTMQRRKMALEEQNARKSSKGVDRAAAGMCLLVWNVIYGLIRCLIVANTALILHDTALIRC